MKIIVLIVALLAIFNVAYSQSYVSYNNEVVTSDYTYPKSYLGPKNIKEQIQIIADIFNLDGTQALKYAKKLPKLPEGAEGWFALPKASAVSDVYFRGLIDSDNQYCKVLGLALAKIEDRANMMNYLNFEISNVMICQNNRTLEFLRKLESEQPGDIIIVAAQYGLLHRGESVRRSISSFKDNEFGLNSFHLVCMALVHPERHDANSYLNADCAGDVINKNYKNVKTPSLFFGGDRLRFGAYYENDVVPNGGTVSAFIPVIK